MAKNEIAMPALGMAMTHGTLVRWMKVPGDPVNVGEPVAEIETDKATMELLSDYSGRLGEHLFAEGAEVPVGEPIVVVLDMAASESHGSVVLPKKLEPPAGGQEAAAVSPITVPDRSMYRFPAVLLDSAGPLDAATIAITGLDADILMEWLGTQWC